MRHCRPSWWLSQRPLKLCSPVVCSSASPGADVWSAFIVEIPYLAAQALIFSPISYWIVQFRMEAGEQPPVPAAAALSNLEVSDVDTQPSAISRSVLVLCPTHPALCFGTAAADDLPATTTQSYCPPA